MDLGTFGTITVKKLPTGKHRAWTRIRDYDGSRRQITATGDSSAAAERNLKKAIAERQKVFPSETGINRHSTIGKLTEVWLEELVASGLAVQTISRYRQTARNTILPAFEDLAVTEMTTGRINKWLKALAAKHLSEARSARVVIRAILEVAVNRDAIDRNPGQSLLRLPKPSRSNVALSLPELARYRTLVKKYRTGDGVRGPRPSSDLADVTDVMLGSSARIAEALALRKEDVDLTVTPPTIRIAGTIIYRERDGDTPGMYLRQGYVKGGKRDADEGVDTARVVPIPGFTAVALRRRIDNAEGDLLFATKKGNPISPNNIRRTLRDVVAKTELAGLHPHTFRKTVATLIDEEYGTETASKVLGHSDEKVTSEHYIQKRRRAPDVTDVTSRLGP